MLSLSGWQIVLLVIAGFLLFGAKGLPKIAKRLGGIVRKGREATREFREAMQDVKDLNPARIARNALRDEPAANKSKPPSGSTPVRPQSKPDPARAESETPERSLPKPKQSLKASIAWHPQLTEDERARMLAMLDKHAQPNSTSADNSSDAN